MAIVSFYAREERYKRTTLSFFLQTVFDSSAVGLQWNRPGNSRTRRSTTSLPALVDLELLLELHRLRVHKVRRVGQIGCAGTFA